MSSRDLPQVPTSSHETSVSSGPPGRSWIARLAALRQVSITQSGTRFAVYGTILLATVAFMVLPNDLPPWRFFGTLGTMAALATLYTVPTPASREDATPRTAFLWELLPAATLALLANMLGLHAGPSFLPYLFFVLVGHSVTVLPLAAALGFSIGTEAVFLGFLHFG